MESMDDIPPSSDTYYTGVSWSTGHIADFSYLIAETEAGKRQHRRVIGDSANIPDWSGRPILYVDTYDSGDEPEVFAYARHALSAVSFFAKLNEFLEVLVQENSELRNTSFPFLLAINGRARVGEATLPFQVDWKNIARTTFFRLDLPFGAFTVEFVQEKLVAPGVNFRVLVKGGMLSRMIETPLVGFDFSASDLYKPLLISTHWAAELVPPEVLEGIVGEAATAVLT